MRTFTVTLISILLFSGSVSAQNKATLPPDCIKYLSYYQEDYKAKKNDDALANWRKAMAACPGNASQNLYVHGTSLMTKRYQALNDANSRKSIADTILLLQDLRIKYYPQKKDDILNNKGLYMITYLSDDPKALCDGLRSIAGELGAKTSNSILVNLFKNSVALYKKGEYDSEAVLENYDLVNSAFEGKSPVRPDDKDDLAKARNVVGTLLADCRLATCESLVGTFSPRLAAEPENASLAATIIRLMNETDDCAGSELYFQAVTLLHRKEPSSRSAYALYRMNAARDNVTDAALYLESAIEADDSDEAADARYAYELASYCYRNRIRGKALEWAKKAVELNHGYSGKGYILIGNLYASAPCDGELQRYARYWAATDYYQKAIAADPDIRDEAYSAIASAAKKYPDASEVFMYDLSAGQTYTFSCGGMSATTTVKTRK